MLRDALAPALIHRLDYQPAVASIGPVDLNFDLGLAQTHVVAEFDFTMRQEAVGEPLVLDGDGLTLEGVWIDGLALPADAYAASPARLEIFRPPTTGRLRIAVCIRPDQNTELMGLYASRGGLYTQCESQGFRRIVYFLDRPDVMTTYTVTLEADAEAFPVLLSNGNLMEESVRDGRRRAVWHDPFPKPCYLFALVAADLSSIEKRITSISGAEKLLQVYTKAEDIRRADHALASLERAVRWDEQRFGLELDLDRFMIVAVPDFNSGAMENKGLNLFNTRYVLADPDSATDRDYELVEAVIGHEYFHNYTGNRITCRDWFQLTLKEGLTVLRDQEFTADQLAEGLDEAQAASARAVKRIDDVRTLRAHQFPEDAGPMAHPIRPQQYEEIRNFYTATVYEKGAEVIRMLLTLFGRDGFRQGMDLYFKRHDGTAATCEDFVSSILDANGRSDLFGDWMRWYDTLGTPVVAVKRDWDAGQQSLRLTFSQTRDPRNAEGANPQTQSLPLPLRFGLLDERGDAVESSSWTVEASSGLEVLGADLVLLRADEATLSLRLMGHTAQPVASLLRGFSAPVRLVSDLSSAEKGLLAAGDPDAFNRWDAFQLLMLDQLMPEPQGDLEQLLGLAGRLLADPRLSPAFQAAALALPAETVVAETWAAAGHAVDPLAIRLSIDRLRLAFAQAPGLQRHLEALDAGVDRDAREAYSADAATSGDRALALMAQSLISRAAHAHSSCQEAACTRADQAKKLLTRLKASPHLTGRLAHLQGLLALGGEEAEEGLAWFHGQVRHNPLALDRWFSLQAGSIVYDDLEGAGAVARIERLLAHPGYDIGNPNRVRAVLAAFFMQNPAGLHQADGSGYELWARELEALDRRNSQLASRLMRSLDRWAVLEPLRRAKVQRVLERLAEKPGLSSDAREVVARLLQAG